MQSLEEKSRLATLIVLSGDPISTNHYLKVRGGFRYVTPEARSLKESYQWQAKAQWRSEPLSKRLKVSITLFFKDKRRRDWDNWHKLSMDALSGIVWVDDEQIDEAIVRKAIDKAQPRIEISVYELSTF